MYRSIPFLLLASTTLLWTSSAHADLDALLGDWAEDASNEASLGAANDLRETSPLAESNQEAATGEVAKDEAASRHTTLTSNHGVPTPVASSQAHHPDLYQVPQPVANPYVSSSCSCNQPSGCKHASCGCDNIVEGCTGSSCKLSSGKGCGSCGNCSGQCGALVAGCIEGQSECRPHRRPSLPPPSTFLQYFNSRNSYSGIWSGYAEETRTRPRNKSPHLDGTWRCRGCGALVEANDVACGCGCGH